MKKLFLIIAGISIAFFSYADTIVTLSQNRATKTFRLSVDTNCKEIDPAPGVTVVDCKIVPRNTVINNAIPVKVKNNVAYFGEGKSAKSLFTIK